MELNFTVIMKRKLSTLIIGFALFPLLFASIGCSNKADSYEHLVKEYREVLCIVMDENAEFSVKTKALERQVELNEEYQKAVSELSGDEQGKLMTSWANMAMEVSEGKCN